MLDFFITPAYAQAGSHAGAQPNALMSMLPLLALVVLFYFMLIRPQMKRSKEHKQMLEKLSKGDEVLTSGGMAGTVREIGESFVTVEVADKVLVKLQRQSISSVLPKGTLKAS